MSLERKPVKFNYNGRFDNRQVRDKTYIKSPFNDQDYPGTPNIMQPLPSHRSNGARSLPQSRDTQRILLPQQPQQMYVVKQKQPAHFTLKQSAPPEPQFIDFPAPGPTNVIVKGPPPPPTQILKMPMSQQPNIIVKGPPPLPPQILKLPPHKQQDLIIKGLCVAQFKTSVGTRSNSV
jgi:hypothetical protein